MEKVGIYVLCDDCYVLGGGFDLGSVDYGIYGKYDSGVFRNVIFDWLCGRGYVFGGDGGVGDIRDVGVIGRLGVWGNRFMVDIDSFRGMLLDAGLCYGRIGYWMDSVCYEYMNLGGGSISGRGVDFLLNMRDYCYGVGGDVWSEESRKLFGGLVYDYIMGYDLFRKLVFGFFEYMERGNYYVDLLEREMFGSYLLDWLFGKGGYIGGILLGGRDGVYYGRAVYMFIMYLYDEGYEGDDGGEDFCFNLFCMGNVDSYIE